MSKLRMPRRPKLLSLPKAPKAGASNETIKRYIAKCSEVEKKNADRMKPYNKAVSDYKKAKSERERLKKQAADARARRGVPKGMKVAA